ncbi:MAG: metallophosphoesterase [Deltaproteobacteria bacterium]|jgi:predicted MPP superfamily phosphohydrolase|nr:metallophosphoesterase [Deltaproteobacteria bacterium]
MAELDEKREWRLVVFMFLNFALVLSGYVFLSYILRLPVGRLAKLGLLAFAFLSAGQLMIFRYFFGGLGGIEASRWLLLVTSFLQGLIFFLFLLSLVRDLGWLLSFAVGKGIGKSVRVWLNGGTAALVMLVLAFGLDLVGMIGAAKVPEVKRSEVVITDWPEGLDGLRVAVLADMHISRFFDRDWVTSVVERTMAEKPDLILLPGDMVDGRAELRAPDVAPLADLGAPYGIWACAGNHEYISQIREWLPVFEQLGIHLLYNAHQVILPRGIPVIVAGLADPTAMGSRYNMPGPDLHLALEGAPEGLPVILMDHRPGRALENVNDPRVSFQLSGHTHGGMMPILSLMVKRANGGFLRGFYDLGDLKLFVHPGVGLWAGFPIRLLNPSEITILTIKAPGPLAMGESLANGRKS